jgi:hypothetical protein
MRSIPLRITLASLLIAFVAVISSMTLAAASQPYPFEGARKHLYVSDAGGHVFLLPFQANGLPSATPEATLDAAVGPGGLAFDSRNDLYVASQDSEQVRIFAPGPHGATRLTNTFNFSELFDEDIAVGPDDYVYVAVYPESGGSFINIYPPGIGDPSKPVAQVSISTMFGDFTLDRTGALYVRGLYGVLVYSHPRISQVADVMISPPNGYYMYDVYGGISVDRDNQLRFEVHTDSDIPWGNADFVVHALAGRATPDRLISTRDCTGEGGYPGLGDGAAVRQPYLFYACHDDGVVLVYRADVFGRQRAVMRIGGSGPIQQPDNVIVGE